MRVYSLFDRKLREYGNLVLMNNNDAVRRALVDGLPQGSLAAKYPGDFDIMWLGDFDPETGVIQPCLVPVLVENLATVVQTPAQES